MSRLRALLEHLIRPLVDHPDEVRLDWVETPEVTLFYLTAGRGDLGRILGKEGRTIEEIRRVMEAVAAHLGREVIIDVVERPKPKPSKAKAKAKAKAKQRPGRKRGKAPSRPPSPSQSPAQGAGREGSASRRDG